VKLPEALNIRYVYVPSLFTALALDVYENGDAGTTEDEAPDAADEIPLAPLATTVNV
jgi:hypothetical protein